MTVLQEFRRCCTAWVRRSWRGPRRDEFLDFAGVENLESRSMLAADIVPIGFDVANDNFAPGQGVPILWQLTNFGLDYALQTFDIAFYLSTDSVISPADVLVGVRTLPPLFPPLYTIPAQLDTIVLPPATHPIWNASGIYFLGMVVDPTDLVIESNESNNSNQGLGFDLDFLFVSGGTASQPDLSASNLSISTVNPTAGTEVQVSFTVSNWANQSAGPFEIAVYASKDEHITTADQRLGTLTLSGLQAQTSISTTATVTLLPAGDPTYNDGQLVLGLIVDSNSQVSESNESNNANQGLGIDVASFLVSNASTVYLEDLPATGFPPGELLSEYLLRSRQYVDAAVADIKDVGRSAAGIVDSRALVSSLRRVSVDLRRLHSLIQPLRTGRRSAVELGANLVLDRTQLEYIERYLIYFMKSQRPGQAAAALAAGDATTLVNDGPTTLDANDDDFATLQEAKKAILEAFDPTRIYGDAADVFMRVGGIAARSGQATAAALAMKASVLTTAIGRMARYGRAKILEGDPLRFDEARDQSHETLTSALWNDISSEIQSYLASLTPMGERVVDWVDDLRSANGRLSEWFDQAQARFQSLFTADRGRAFRGKWTGTQESVIIIGGVSFSDSGMISITFKSNRDGSITGTVRSAFSTVDEFGNVLHRGTTTGRLNGRFIDREQFVGNIDLRAPNGLQVVLPFNWHFDGLNLSGSLYDGSSTTFTIRKK